MKNKKALICTILLTIIIWIGFIFLIALGPKCIIYFFSGYGIGTILVQFFIFLYDYLRKGGNINE